MSPGPRKPSAPSAQGSLFDLTPGGDGRVLAETPKDRPKAGLPLAMPPVTGPVPPPPSGAVRSDLDDPFRYDEGGDEGPLDLRTMGLFTDDEDPFRGAESEEEEEAGPRVYSVTELATALKDTLEDQFPEILVQGELADFKGVHRSGHLYCGLKDAKSQIRLVMWKGSLSRLPFELKGGLEVIVTGKLDFYGGSGSLQIVAERMEPVGIGALQLKFEQLKEKLKAEGLFEAARKRKVSPLNWRVGIVTTLTGAALQDMLKIFRSRFPLGEVFVFHASVQGEKAPAELIKAIASANRYSAVSPKPLDVLIVGRGGGSYEDLFCFNDEGLARAIVASKVPTVSAVGHEIDFTIADMVADRRAATPSHAAQETVPELRLWTERLADLERIFERRVRQAIAEQRQRVDTAYSRVVAAAPQRRLQQQKELLAREQRRLENLAKSLLDRRKADVARAAQVLDALSPLKVLDRGYAIAQDGAGKAVRSVRDVKAGDELGVKLKDGVVKARAV
jgi:exodeoxyribonuclease VII large subunit